LLEVKFFGRQIFLVMVIMKTNLRASREIKMSHVRYLQMHFVRTGTFYYCDLVGKKDKACVDCNPFGTVSMGFAWIPTENGSSVVPSFFIENSSIPKTLYLGDPEILTGCRYFQSRPQVKRLLWVIEQRMWCRKHCGGGGSG